jgi:hypothetical protein
LCDAALPMRALFCAVKIVVVDASIFVNPSDEQLAATRDEHATFELVYRGACVDDDGDGQQPIQLCMQVHGHFDATTLRQVGAHTRFMRRAHTHRYSLLAQTQRGKHLKHFGRFCARK